MDDSIKQRLEPVALAKKYGSLIMMRTVPDNAADRQAIGNDLWSGILLRFEQSLSASDKKLWQSMGPTWRDSPECRRLINTFDNFVLGQFQHWGWRLLMSRGILMRLADWEEHSPERFRRLGEALQFNSQVWRSEARAPIDGGQLYEFKEKVFPELKILLRKVASVFGSRATSPSSLEIANWMEQEIEDSPKDFRFLWANLSQLHGFVAGIDRDDTTFAARLKAGAITPKEFIYRWLATTHRRDVEVVRQIISNRKRPRSARRSFLKV